MPKNSYDESYYKKTDEFRGLLRVIGTSIDGNRNVIFGLSQVHGVGRRLAQAICRVYVKDIDPDFDPKIRIGLITEEQQKKLIEMIKDPVKFGIPKYLVNRQKDLRTGEYRHISGTDIDLVLKMDIDRMKRTRSWKGIRHMYGLKVRGQHTRTTGRQGLVIGFMRKQFMERSKKKEGEK